MAGSSDPYYLLKVHPTTPGGETIHLAVDLTKPLEVPLTMDGMIRELAHAKRNVEAWERTEEVLKGLILAHLAARDAKQAIGGAGKVLRIHQVRRRVPVTPSLQELLGGLDANTLGVLFATAVGEFKAEAFAQAVAGAVPEEVIEFVTEKRESEFLRFWPDPEEAG